MDQRAKTKEPLRRVVQDWCIALIAAIGIFVMYHWADIPLNP